MTSFQWITISFLSLLILGEGLLAWVDHSLSRIRLLRILVWSLAGLAIACPDLVQIIAQFLGIGRGTDIVLYAFVLAFMCSSFYFYSRTVRLQRQITEIIRHQALREAQRVGYSEQEYKRNAVQLMS